MRLKKVFLRVAALGVMLAVATAMGVAQAETATDFYMKYRAAFAKARAIEDLFPLMSKETKAEVESTPKGERPKMFEFVKEMSKGMTGVKVVKETKTDTGAMLTVEAMDGKDQMTGQITIVKEGSAWKMGKESWSSK
jgi:uncharacterized protein DUF4878